jgi:3' terminal RNA ribose 2'-O-methyltransferase Hen1
VDLGCGEGRLLKLLLADRRFEKIVGLDTSLRSLEVAAARLSLDRLPPMQRARIDLLHGALTYRDKRLEGFEAATVVEVIEHLDPARLSAFERVLFEFAKPDAIIVTTPNREYNVKFEGLPEGAFRHQDHRFEWTRAEFAAWAERVAKKYGYTVQFEPIGEHDPDLGAPTQMAVFETCA